MPNSEYLHGVPQLSDAALEAIKIYNDNMPDSVDAIIQEELSVSKQAVRMHRPWEVNHRNRTRGIYEQSGTNDHGPAGQAPGCPSID